MSMSHFETDRLIIRLLSSDDEGAFGLFENKNQPFWQPFLPLTQHQFKFEELLRNQTDGHSLRFVLRRKDYPAEIIGTTNYSQIFRGPFQACFLGYKIAEEHEGKGLMREALNCTLPYILKEHHIHRIMANYMPSNTRSEKLLQGLGFQKEGYAKDYLLINGKWEDHILTALTNPHWS